LSDKNSVAMCDAPYGNKQNLQIFK